MKENHVDAVRITRLPERRAMTVVRRIRLSPPRRIPEPLAPPVVPQLIVERDASFTGARR
jgi:hypothetical protein